MTAYPSAPIDGATQDTLDMLEAALEAGDRL